MATSGSTSFNFNRNQIILAALRKIGAIASGETPDNQTIQDCSDQLNSMVKALDATGLHLWTETEATLFLQPKQVAYTFGATDNATETYTATSVATTAVVNGATTVTVASVTGITTGYNIGILGDAGTILWTTVNGAPVGAVVTLQAATTDSATIGNAVYVYQNKIVRPLRVISSRRYNFASSIDTQMIPLSRIDYRNMPNKTNTGTVTQWFYDPKGGTNANGSFYVWPAPPDATNAVKFTWMRPIQDFLTAGNNPDLPQEWLDPLVWNLALKMAPEYDCPANRYTMIEKQAAASLANVMGFDREPESYLFGFNADQTS